MLRKVFMLLSCVVVLWSFGYANAAEYVGSDKCAQCHPGKYNDWVVSGHPYKLRKAEAAKLAGLPLPEGYTWDDISYVIGGSHKKSRYMDKKGYIITKTGVNKDKPGKNQYNIETGTWSNYHPGEIKKYDCGSCHTTGYNKKGHQDGLEGITGTWKFPGVQCEQCHGSGKEHAASGDKTKITVNKSAQLCGSCHIRGAKEKIPASGGFIRHHETFNELSVSEAGAGKSSMDCVTCHDPHKRAKFSIKKDCAACHAKESADFKGAAMQVVGVTCADCHMPKATKSATKKGKYEGDIRTHVFKINTSADAKMFYQEPKLDKKGKPVMGKDGKPAMNLFARGYVDLGFACLNCHKNKDMNWAAAKAKGIHAYGKK